MRAGLRSLLAPIVTASAIAGCAAGAGEAFLTGKGLGDRAYSSGRYEEAANAYEQAGTKALRAGDRAEAMYLAGSSFWRARAWDRARAMFERLMAELPKTDRARRAHFDLADLEIEAGHVDRGYAILLDAAEKDPTHGLAHRAIERWVDRLAQGGGDALAWLKEAQPRLAATELDETIRYLTAGRLEKAGDLAASRDTYLACAERHPYPQGSLFDDALWRASLLDETLGRPDAAIDDLRRMLSVREPSTFVGSYERPRFSAAQFRIAVLYRDKVRDDASARREFHRLYADHTTSVLRDDALWEEATLAKKDGDTRSACSLVVTLTEAFPGSRYAACTRSLCATANLASADAGACHPYVLRGKSEDGGD